MGGTNVMINIANLDPIMVYDLKRNRSPNTNPTKPDRKSQNQDSDVASTGNNNPLVIIVKILRKKNAKNNRITLTDKEPTFILADSKASAVIVQKIAVHNAANSPR